MTLSGLSHLLRNPFYIGYLDAQKTGELLPGIHQPLVEKKLFFDVQTHLKTRIWPRRPSSGSARVRMGCGYSDAP